MHWVIQSSLGHSPELARLAKVCQSQGHAVHWAESPPFSEVLPDVSTEAPAIFYGSARFAALVHAAGRWHPGVFWDDERFRASTWRRHLVDHLINADAQHLLLREVLTHAAIENRADHHYFVRPDRDLKDFAGQCMTGSELHAFATRIVALGEEASPRPDTEILIASPKTLLHEWRLFMVEGQLCSGSHYRSAGRLDVRPEVLDRVREFAEARSATWEPAPVYALDIGEVSNTDGGRRLGIIEYNGFNSSGFYAADVERVVASVSRVALSLVSS